MGGKRLFYEDDEFVTTKPGVNAEIKPELAQKEGAHGNIRFIDGMGVRSTPFLERHANTARQFLHHHLSIIGAELATQKTALSNEWANLTKKVDEVVVDPVFPNVVSFVFPILAVNVFFARLALPTRFLIGVFTTGVSLEVNMPRTYKQISHIVLDFEKEHFPKAFEQQKETAQSFQQVLKQAETFGQQAKLDLQQLIHNARKYVIEALKDD